MRAPTNAATSIMALVADYQRHGIPQWIESEDQRAEYLAAILSARQDIARAIEHAPDRTTAAATLGVSVATVARWRVVLGVPLTSTPRRP